MLTLFNCNSTTYALVPWLAKATEYPPQFVLTEHRHRPYHLVFITKGRCRLETDTRVVSLAEKDIVLIQPGEKHVFRTGPEVCQNFAFNFYLLEISDFRAIPQEQFAQIENLAGILEKKAESRNLDTLFRIDMERPLIHYDRESWADIVQELDSFSADTAFRGMCDPDIIAKNISWYLYRCAHFFNKLLALISPEQVSPSFDTAARDRIVSAVKQWIHKHTNEPYSLQLLAKQTGYSPSYLCSHFSTTTGMTIGACSTAAKIRRARELLRNSSRNITSVAVELGFSSSQHFSRAFKQETGCSARKWRAKQLFL